MAAVAWYWERTSRAKANANTRLRRASRMLKYMRYDSREEFSASNFRWNRLRWLLFGEKLFVLRSCVHPYTLVYPNLLSLIARFPPSIETTQWMAAYTVQDCYRSRRYRSHKDPKSSRSRKSLLVGAPIADS